MNSMTAQEKKTIETILLDIGLEPLNTADDCEDLQSKPLVIVKTTR